MNPEYASGDPIEGPAPALRYEIKLPLYNRTPAAVEFAIVSHPMGFELHHPDRTIQNVYFDTPDLTCFHMSQGGADRRVKLRMRWYGEEDSPRAGQLEWKWRRGALGWKWTVPVDWQSELGKGSWRELREDVRPELNGWQRAILDSLAIPSLFNRYTRSYYVSRDGRCRLTRDRCLAFGPQTGGLALQRWREIPYRRFEILELKVESSNYRDARRALAGLPYRPARFSKYTAGIELFLGA